MEPEVLAALIAAVFSLVIAWLTRRNQAAAEERNHDRAIELTDLQQKQEEKLKVFEQKLADTSAERDARREYEYKARLRLYEQCDPLLFEISELAERSIGRIRRLAYGAREGWLKGEESWLNKHYFRLSTYYRTLALVPATRLLRRRLTFVDLSLDDNLHWTYEILCAIEDTFTDDFKVAKEDPKLPYDPHGEEAKENRSENPRKYHQQGIPRGILGSTAAAMLISLDDGSQRLMDYSEFEQSFPEPEEDGDGPPEGAALRKAIGRISYFYDEFHPRERPVAWRVLLAQVLLCRGLLKSLERLPLDGGFWNDLWTEKDEEKDQERLRWQGEEEESGDTAKELKIIKRYVTKKMDPVMKKLLKRRADKETAEPSSA